MTIVRVIILTAVLVLFGTWVHAADCNSGGRYEDMGGGTVQDCRTGLIWLKDANCRSTSGGVTPNGIGALTWSDAMKWAAGLHDTGTPGTGCGLSDGSLAGHWRLPTRTEWMAMVAYAKSRYSDPSLTNAAGTGKWTTNGDAFNNVIGGDYWSSTPYINDATQAWSASVHWGNMVGNQKTNNVYIWPVRGGQSGSFGEVTVQ